MKRFICGLLFLFCIASLTAADIAVLTIASGGDYQKCVKLGTDSKRDYCQKHGYDFIFCEAQVDPSRSIYWSKLLLALQVLETDAYQWIVWLDADTIIMNQDIPLEDIIDKNVNFSIGKDWNGINSGVFYLRSCEWSRQFLTDVYSRTDCLSHHWPEQIAMAREIEENPEYGPLVKIVPQRLFNSYPHETSSSLASTYQPGDFLIHFASIHDHGYLLSLFQKYAPKAVNDRKLVTLDQYLGYYGFSLSPQDSHNNEGYMSNEQKQQYKERLSLYPDIESVLEIGLNGGHSADNFLQTCTNLKKFVSFDINMHGYTQPAADYFKRTYKEKFEFIPGDSALTVPQYASDFPDQKFDLIYVDGKHTYEYVIEDIMNCRALAHPDTILWVDDYWSFIQDAVLSLQAKGIIQVVHVQQSWGGHGGRSWMEARYVFPKE